MVQQRQKVLQMAEMSGSLTDLVPSRAALKEQQTETDGPKVGLTVLPTRWEGYLPPSWARHSTSGSHSAGWTALPRRMDSQMAWTTVGQTRWEIRMASSSAFQCV